MCASTTGGNIDVVDDDVLLFRALDSRATDSSLSVNDRSISGDNRSCDASAPRRIKAKKITYNHKDDDDDVESPILT